MDSGLGSITIDRRVRVADGTQLSGDVQLPDAPGAETHRDAPADAIGRVISEHPLVVASLAALGGGVAAARTAGTAGGVRGLVRTAAAVIAGAATGAAAAITGGALINAGRRSDSPSPATPVAPATVAESGEQLRVMNWNIRELIGPDGTLRGDDAALQAVVEVIKREQPDVLVLQEVSGNSLTSLGRNNVDELVQALGATSGVLVTPGVRITGREKGNAVITFGDTKIDDARALRHPDLTGEGVLRRVASVASPLASLGVDLPDVARQYHPRATADVMVTTPAGTAVRVLGVHMSGTGRNTGGTPDSTAGQDAQVGALLPTLDAWEGATIMAGDFNIRSGTSQGVHEADLLGRAGLADVATQLGIDAESAARRTYPSANPKHAIDRVYVSDDVRAAGINVLDDPTVRAASDHLPIVADLELHNP